MPLRRVPNRSCGEHLPPTDRFAVVFPHRGKMCAAGAAQNIRPLWGRTGGEAARWGQVGEPRPYFFFSPLPPNGSRSFTWSSGVRVTTTGGGVVTSGALIG